MKLFMRVIIGITALICAFLFFVSMVENDFLLKAKLESKLISVLSSSLDCQFRTKVERINFLTGTCTLRNTFVKAHGHDDWNWKADTIDIKISLLDMLWKKKIIASIAIHHIHITSEIRDGQLAIIPHLKKYISPSLTPFPFEAQQLSIFKGTAITGNAELGGSGIFRGYAKMSNCSQLPPAYLFYLGIDQGKMSLYENKLVEELTGKCEGQIALGKNRESSINFNGSCHLPQLPLDDQTCTIFGSINLQEAQLHYMTDSKILQADCLVNYQQDTYAITASAPCSYLLQCAKISIPHFEGQCSVKAQGKPSSWQTTLDMQACLDKCFYRGLEIPSLSAHSKYQSNQTFGITVQCHNVDKHIAEAECVYNHQDKTIRCNGKNTTHLVLAKNWSIPQENLTFECTITGQEELYGTYQIIFVPDSKNSSKTIKGIARLTKDHIILQGSGESCTYDLLIGAQPRWHLEYCNCFWNNTPIVSLKAQSSTTFEGTIGYPLVRFLTQTLGCYAAGEEEAQLTGSIGKIVNLDIALKNGNIRLPYTYNLLQDIHASLLFDTASGLFHINNVDLQFHKGKIHASRVTGQLNEFYQLAYLHVPFLLNNCFISMKKDFFAMLSGALSFTYFPKKPASLSGFITLDRSHIRSNILSGELQKQILGSGGNPVVTPEWDVNMQLNALTRSPLRVKTSFLDATTHLQAQVTGSLSQPMVSGMIEFVNGSFLFPYKPLFIKRGKLYFLPHQTHDPVVDILAENNIRKYAVQMTVNGTIKHPNIAFNAAPTLEEEQIIALLLGGTEDGSLFLAMPTSVMNSIQHLLFGPAHTTSQFQRTLKNLFSPLKNLRITPSFSDQTARGGLRGSLIIDVNDRLRAIIEQNFSLTEDVVIQVEYDLSDDARIRATKDERGDLGGELEGRWKF